MKVRNCKNIRVKNKTRKKEKVKDLKRVLREFLGLVVLSFSRQSAFSIYYFISIKYALFTNYNLVSEVS